MNSPANLPASQSIDHESGTAAVASQRRQLGAALIGNVLEYYDFVVYAFLANSIAKQFFHGTDVAAMLATFAAFGVGFLARPLGGLVIGRVADVYGRTRALQITIFGMAIGTVGIGALPGVETIGAAAPILLVTLRLIQGFAAGGEWGSATTYIVESAPAHRRGFFGSIGQAAIASAALVSSGVVTLLNWVYDPITIDAWAWRLPFLAGFLMLPLGIYMRRNLKETLLFQHVQQSQSLKKIGFGETLRRVAIAFGFTAVWTVSYYVVLSYMPTFLAKHAGLTPTQALTANTIALVALVILTPVFGLISDRIGRKPLLLACCIGLAFGSVPAFNTILNQGSFGSIVLILLLLNVILAAFSGAAPAALCEIFPTTTRTVGLSVGYSLATAIFGGFAPYISTSLIAHTGLAAAPAYYVVSAAVISFIAIVSLKETAKIDLL